MEETILQQEGGAVGQQGVTLHFTETNTASSFSALDRLVSQGVDRSSGSHLEQTYTRTNIPVRRSVAFKTNTNTLHFSSQTPPPSSNEHMFSHSWCWVTNTDTDTENVFFVSFDLRGFPGSHPLGECSFPGKQFFAMNPP